MFSLIHIASWLQGYVRDNAIKYLYYYKKNARTLLHYFPSHAKKPTNTYNIIIVEISKMLEPFFPKIESVWNSGNL